MITKSRIAERNAEIMRLAKLEENRRLSKIRGKKEAREYLSATHEFTLCISDQLTPIKRSMTGIEARKLNRLNILKFGGGECKQLLQWTPRKRNKDKRDAHDDLGYGGVGKGYNNINKTMTK